MKARKRKLAVIHERISPLWIGPVTTGVALGSIGLGMVAAIATEPFVMALAAAGAVGAASGRIWASRKDNPQPPEVRASHEHTDQHEAATY